MTSRRAASRFPANLQWQVFPVGGRTLYSLLPTTTAQSLFHQVSCCRYSFCSPAHQQLAPFPYVTHIAKQVSNARHHAGNLKRRQWHRQKQGSCALQKRLCLLCCFFFSRRSPHLSHLCPPLQLKFKVMFQYVNCEPATLHLHEKPSSLISSERSGVKRRRIAAA